jgi:hypothetical protein
MVVNNSDSIIPDYLLDSNNTCIETNDLKKGVNDTYEFPLDKKDTIFTLTPNNSSSTKGIGILACKMMVVKELSYVNLNDMSNILGGIGIKKLLILSINNHVSNIDIKKANKGCFITYMEMNSLELKKMLKSDADFYEYNKFSLYILRGGIYIDIKNIFQYINDCKVYLGRGGSQKSHILSPLDLRLSTYLMAMFNFDYNLIKDQNTFNTIDKDRYLTYRAEPYNFVSIKQ